MIFGLPIWAAIVIVILFVGASQRGGGGRGRFKGWKGQDEMERRIAELEESHRQLSAGDTAELERRLAELEERVDFAERMLAKKNDAERLGPPKA